MTKTCWVVVASAFLLSTAAIDAQPVLTPLSQTNVACNGGSNGAAAVGAAGGGTAPYTYNWTPGNPTGDGTTNVTGLTAGTWTCTVTDANSCTTTQTFNITQPTAIVVTPQSQTNVACNGGTTGAASINTPTGGAGGYTYNWTPGNPTGDGTTSVTGLTAGTWTCTVTDANSCTRTQTFNITQPPAISVTALSQTNVSCNGGSNGAASINTPTGGAGGYMYNWTPGNPTGDGTTNVTGLTAGTWTCTVTDANGCTASQTFNITQPTAINLTVASQTNVSCNGGANGAASVISASGGAGGYMYNWTPGNPTGDGTTSVTGLTAGTWTCTVTDANSCTTTQTFNITQPAALVATITAQTNVSCNGGSNGSATVTPSGGTAGYTYSWAPSGGTGATATGLSAGSYTVTVTDANSCMTTASATITQPSVISVTPASQTNVSCNGGSNGAASINTPTGGAGGYTYDWTPGNPTGDGTTSVTGLTAGTWTCTVTDANSCTRTQTFNITQPTAITVTAASQTNVSCNGGANGAASINAPTGGAGGYTYNWTPGNPTGDGTTSVTGLTAGTWTCTVTDANSCTKTQTFNITQPTAITASTSQVNVSCNGGSNGSATVAPSGGAGSYTYSWAPSGGTGATATGLAAGTYTCTITDANSCQATQTFNITQPATLVATFSAQTNVACNGGSNGSATVTPSGGTAGYTYSWAPSGGTGATANGLSAGSYTVTVTDANSCTTTATATITQPSAIALTPASQTNVSCNGASNGAASINTPTGGAGGYTYDWTPGNPTGDGTTSVTGLTAGTWTCTVTDANSCTTTQTFDITQPAAITATVASQANLSCNGAADGAASVNAATGGAGGYTYDWTPGNPTGDGTTSVTGLSAGIYTVTVTDANGCSSTQSFSITEPPQIAVSLSTHSNVSCNGGSDGSATVSASGGIGTLSYSWAPSGGNAATATGLSAGSYTCTVTDGNGCTATQAVTLAEPPPLVATVSGVDPSSPVECDGTASVVVSGGTAPFTISWSPGAESASTIGSLCEGSYTVTVTDANGCVATATTTLFDPLVPTPPDPKIVVNGCTTVGGPCFLTAASISGRPQFAWSYAWRLDGVAAGSTKTITPSIANPGSFQVAVEVVEWGEAGAASTTLVVATPCSAGLLCLQGGRFEVGLTARDVRTGSDAAGVPLPRNDLYGLFALPALTGSADNPEVFVKVIDGRPVNGRFWVFYGGLTDLEYTLTVNDKEAGDTRTYTKPAGSASGGFDVGSGVTPEECAGEVDATPAGNGAAGTCVAAEDRLCLLGGRFGLRLAARDPRTGAAANGVAFAQGDLFGHFALPALTGDAANPEVFVKVLDGRIVNGHFWVFFAGLTDLEYTLEVTDGATGATKSYTKAAGSACGAFDTNGW